MLDPFERRRSHCGGSHPYSAQSPLTGVTVGSQGASAPMPVLNGVKEAEKGRKPLRSERPPNRP